MNFNNLQQMQSLQSAFAQMQQARKPLVEFKAGICDFHLSETKVVPDKRKGKLIIKQSASGELTLEWKLRPSGAVDWSRLLLPKSATWERVPECTTGRCFLLRFKHGTPQNKLKFFWMQEPKDDKDEEYLKKINQIIDNPPPPPQMNMNQAYISQMLGGQQMGHGAGVGHPGHSSARSAQQNPFRAMPNTVMPGMTDGNPARSDQSMANALAASLSSFLGNQQMQASARLSLNDVLESDRVLDALDEDDMKRLLQYLPESQRDFTNLRTTLRSPQIQQAYSRLSSILNGPQFNALMASMSLPHAGTLGVGAFLDSIQEQADKKKNEEKKNEGNGDSNKKSDQ